jgi:hypothetical protein
LPQPDDPPTDHHTRDRFTLPVGQHSDRTAARASPAQGETPNTDSILGALLVGPRSSRSITDCLAGAGRARLTSTKLDPRNMPAITIGERVAAFIQDQA